MECEYKYKHVIVLVCGDIGRSPRMQYHTLSLANASISAFSKYRFKVSLVGYTGEKCIPQVVDHPLISIHRIEPFESKTLRKSSWLLFAITKVVFLALQLIYTILIGVYLEKGSQNGKKWNFLDIYASQKRIDKGMVDAILVQNPPSVPTLFLAVALKLFTGCQLIIDWHNLGFTMIAMALGLPNPLAKSEKLSGKKAIIVKIAALYERVLAQFADYNLTVTHMMADWLSSTTAEMHCQTPAKLSKGAIKDEEEKQIQKDEYIVFKLSPKPTVLHDRPPTFFRRTSVSDKHSLFQRYKKDFHEKMLFEKYIEYRSRILDNGASIHSTPSERQTSYDAELIELLNERETLSTFVDVKTKSIKEKIPYHVWYENTVANKRKDHVNNNGEKLRECYFLGFIWRL